MESSKEIKKMRKIIIETDGISLDVDRKEVPSNFELQGILESILRRIFPK